MPVQPDPEIKRFVQETLGCSCPEEVFEHIEVTNDPGGAAWERKIAIGGRLLIYIVSPGGDADVHGLVQAALRQGVEERNDRGYNRFRLVVIVPRGKEYRETVERVFTAADLVDDRTHLHTVDRGDADAILPGFRNQAGGR